MNRAIIHTLFETNAVQPRFESLRDELEAVQSGRKSMSVFSAPLSDIANDGDIKKVFILALQMKIPIVVRHDPLLEENNFCIFIVNNAEIWRVDAYILLLRTLSFMEWSDSLEVFQSILLGYSIDEIKIRLNYINNRNPSWTGITIYCTIDINQYNRVCDLGARCFDPNVHTLGIEFFYSKKSNTLRVDADVLVGSNHIIVRSSVTRDTFTRLFGDWRGWGKNDVIEAHVAPEDLSLLNYSLKHQLEFCKSGNWVTKL